MRFIVKCVFFCLVTGGAIFICQLLDIESSAPIILTLFGSISFFFGEHMTGSGFFMKFHYVDTETPEAVWKMLGILLWIIAAVSIILLSQDTPDEEAREFESDPRLSKSRIYLLGSGTVSTSFLITSSTVTLSASALKLVKMR